MGLGRDMFVCICVWFVGRIWLARLFAIRTQGITCVAICTYYHNDVVSVAFRFKSAKYFAIQDVSEYVYDEVDVSGENVEGYVLYIDDIRYQAPGVHVKGYNIYRDGKKLNEQLLTATDYDEFVPVGNHEYVVTAVYEEGESPVSNVFSAVGDPSNPNAIHFVEANSDKENARYDLSGRRVNGAKKGIFIKNGKKYIVK